ncbi:MAG: EamA family transporter, partial [Burkholderiales bacterium]
LAAAFMWAVSDIIMKYQLKSDSYDTQIFYLTLLITLFTLPLALWQWQMPNFKEGIWLIIAGLLFYINFHGLFWAYHYADLTVVMPYDFSRLIFTSLFAYFIFNEHPNKPTIIGATVIVMSTLYVVYKEKKQGKHSYKSLSQ